MRVSLNSFCCVLTFLFSSLASPGQESVGHYTSGLSQEKNSIIIPFSEATIRVQFVNETVVRITTSWKNQFEEPEPYMIPNYDWKPVKYKMSETKEQFVFQTGRLRVVIYKLPFSVTFFNEDGEILSRGMGSYYRDGTVGSLKQMQPDEHFFGFGERMDFLDRKGRTVDLNVGRGEKRPHIIGAYNVLEANYCPVPFFMSTRGYGIFFHNSHVTHWDMGATDADEYAFEADGGELDYFFIYGPDFGDILNDYTNLTGKSPLMNRFAFGLHVGTYSGGTWGYENMTSTQYVVALVRKFRELGIPIDVLHLDSTWRIFGEKGGKGATTFEWRETFKDPKSMFDSLYALNLSMVGVHLRPRFDNGSRLRLLDSAQQKGFVYPEENGAGEFVNFFNPNAVNWWWNNGVMRVAEQGAMFLKTDEGSAFGRKANESDKVGPGGPEVEALHNIFPLVYAKAPYEKFQDYNKLRGMNHTREGYAGVQRYPFIFAGDWPSEWQYFEPVIKAGLNISMSGVGYWAHCMGGFEHDADPELYVRWCQFGLMSPVAHLFGMDHPKYKEPWNYGEEALKIFRTYDSLRYSLIPFSYTNAWEMYQTGKPLMRPLVLEFQNDVNTYHIADQYLLGSSILVCPVTTKGAQTRSLYLPSGQWYNHWDGNRYEGKQDIHVVTPLDKMPIYYKAGTIIPSQKPVQFIDKTVLKEVMLNVYPDESHVAEGELYDDDGRSLDYQKGMYTITSFRYDGKTLLIDTDTEKFNLPDRTYYVRIHHANPPTQLLVAAGKKKPVSITDWAFDEASRLLSFKVTKAPKQSVLVHFK